MNRNGIALVSVLLCLLVSLVLAATLFFSWFVDALATSNGSAGDEALSIADAGIQHLWSILEPAPSFTRELAWPVGEPSFGAIVGFPAPPRTYRVQVSPAAGGGLTVVSEGTSHRGTRRRVEARFSRAAFRPPAAMIVAPETTIGDASGTVDVSAAGVDPEVPAVAAESRAEGGALRAGGGAVLASAVVVGTSGLANALDGLRAAATTTYDAPQGGGAWGSEASPSITRLIVNAEISGNVTAGGIVVADAPLRVLGRLEVHGLLLAPSGLDVSGELIVHGAIWIATDLRVAAPGTVTLVDSQPALAAAESVGSDLLPRPAKLMAWRELW